MSEQHRPRILLVTRNLPPLVGGMERLNWHMAEQLAKFADVRIVGPEGSAELAPEGVVVREVPLKPLWKFLLVAGALAWRESRVWKPDILFAGSGLTAALARASTHVCGAKSVVYVHGLDVAVKHPLYRAIWLPAIRRMDRVIANSHATAALCRDIGVAADRIGIVHPGVDLPCSAGGLSQSPCTSSHRKPTFVDVTEGGSQQSCSPADFRQRHQLGRRPLLLSVGRLSSRKGLREFVTHALPAIVAMHPELLLLIVGDTPKDAVHAEAQTPASIREAAQQAGVGSNVRFLGVITDYDELGEIYRAADVHVFPVRELPGDPEGFGMVAVEAAAHGLPTVSFATGGIVDAVAEGESGRHVAPGNYTAFADAVLEMLADADTWPTGCIAFASRFAWPTFGGQIVRELQHVLAPSHAGSARG